VNSGKKQREKDHRAMTALCADEPCLLCGAPAPSEPLHWPVHRGMGGGKAGWSVEEIIPGCRSCHQFLDGHNAISEVAQRAHDVVKNRAAHRAPRWRAKMHRRETS